MGSRLAPIFSSEGRGGEPDAGPEGDHGQEYGYQQRDDRITDEVEHLVEKLSEASHRSAAALASISTTGDSTVISVAANDGLRCASGSCAPCIASPERWPIRGRAAAPGTGSGGVRWGCILACGSDEGETRSGGADRDPPRGEAPEQWPTDGDGRDGDEQAEREGEPDVGVQKPDRGNRAGMGRDKPVQHR